MSALKRRMSESKINAMNKNELKGVIKQLQDELNDDVTEVENGGASTPITLNLIYEEIRKLKNESEELRLEVRELREEIGALRDESKDMKDRMKQQDGIIQEQQKFLERVDARERACNIILI
eukprot:GHVO01066550.1.p2 GENE.GHVO01066550.1~~GHVO01066550.1.p2  ORF type:complete len:122 (+),score=21.78 GHVO01066550.1:1038-1403(+)